MLDVLTIGTATRDVFLHSARFRVLRDPQHLRRLGFVTGEAECFALGGKIEVDKPVFSVGGGAANAAITFRRQGFKTAALIKVGRDEHGRAVLSHLRHEKVLPFTLYDKIQGTAYSTILISPNGERTILNYRGASEDLVKAEIPWLKLQARWAYIAPGRIPFAVMRHLVVYLKKRGTRLAMNPSRYYLDLGLRRLRPILSDLEMVILNREEGAYLTGCRYNEEKKIFKKFDELVPGLAIMTDGPHGVSVSDGRKIYRAGIFKEKKVVDRTGAGDAFGSGFVAGLLQKSRLRSILRSQATAEDGQIFGGQAKISAQGGSASDRGNPAFAQAPAVAKALAGKSADRQKSKIGIGKFSEEEIKYAIQLGSANATSVVQEIGAQPGILTRKEFASKPCWRHLTVRVSMLSR